MECNERIFVVNKSALRIVCLKQSKKWGIAYAKKRVVYQSTKNMGMVSGNCYGNIIGNAGFGSGRDDSIGHYC